MNHFVIVGSGGHARELAEVARARCELGVGPTLTGFLDDDPSKHGSELNGLPVLGDLSWLRDHPDHGAIIGIGAPTTKRAVAARLHELAIPSPTLVHPRAELSPFIALAPGVVIAAGCVLTTQIRIGAHAHLNRMCSVGHDCVVGDYVHLAPGTILSGNVTIDEGCDLGTSVSVIPGIRVGAWTRVGAGACVTRDLPSQVTAVGVPARVVTQAPDR